eukprot:scaffold1954_cov268-Pinguiococcus_pyrenoidosus.AAC.12
MRIACEHHNIADGRTVPHQERLHAPKVRHAGDANLAAEVSRDTQVSGGHDERAQGTCRVAKHHHTPAVLLESKQAHVSDLCGNQGDLFRRHVRETERLSPLRILQSERALAAGQREDRWRRLRRNDADICARRAHVDVYRISVALLVGHIDFVLQISSQYCHSSAGLEHQRAIRRQAHQMRPHRERRHPAWKETWTRSERESCRGMERDSQFGPTIQRH